MVTQNQYNVLRQPTRKLNIKIDLINENDNIVDSFEGIATDGNTNLDGNSTHRRSGNLTMVFDKRYNLLPKPDSKIWFNKRIGIHIGIKNYFDEVIWFNIGRFALSDVDLNFNTSEKTMSCTIQDYMSFLDGTLGGTLSHKIIIDRDTPISDAIKSVLTGLVKISVEDIKIDNMDLVLPYTIEKESGSTAYDVIKEIIELYPGWDFSFDENGILIVEKIRDRKNDSVVEVFDGTEKDLSLNTQPKIDFKHTKNSVYVWGRQLDDGTQVKWTYRNRWSRKNKLGLNSLTDKQIGDVCLIEQEDKSYVWHSDKWNLLDFNVVSQFNVEKIGEKIVTESIDTIFNEEQARMRCEYELVNRSNMAETISFSIVPLYNLQVNDKIHINIDSETIGDYLIDTINIPFDISSPMSITAHRLYY